VVGKKAFDPSRGRGVPVKREIRGKAPVSGGKWTEFDENLRN
jgi:hypothetical protein